MVVAVVMSEVILVQFQKRSQLPSLYEVYGVNNTCMKQVM